MAAGTSKVTQNPATAQPGASIPLSDIEVVFQRPARFAGEEGAQPVTIRGKDLAIVLDWMGRSAPGRPTEFEAPEYVADIFEGIAEVCRATTGDEYPDHRLILRSLGTFIEDYSHRVTARSRAEDVAKTAVVRIIPKSPKAVA